MNVKNVDKTLATVLSFILTAALLSGYQVAATGAGVGGAADSAPMSALQLQALVAPIALYPDPLVAQVLAGSTFPDQVAVANYWLQQNKALTGEPLIEAVNKQSWDASVKALTQFPSVLDNMAKNLNWTSMLGEAYHNQPSEVMAAVQKLRVQAKAAGNLKSGPEITVTQESPETIAIEPTNPQVVYVPEYNPAVIYGTPYLTPGYSAAAAATGALLGFGAGNAVGALTSSGCCGWGWGSWNANWHGGAVVYNHNDFYGNRAWHGGYYNGGYHDGYGYHNAYDRAAADYRGTANRVEGLNRTVAPGFEGERALDANSWARANDAFRSSNAFSGFGDRFGGSGWQSRADSFRGWGSMRASGFSGGRFGGGRFGGGRFRR
jgi:Protein of unknown function (DUF3300)